MYPEYRQQCPPGTVSYLVQPGDTFYKIAAKYNTTVPALVSANPLVNPNFLSIGQKICVPKQPLYPPCPEGNYYTIKAGDTLYGIARSYKISVDDLVEANPGINPYMLMIGQVICIPLATPPVTCPEGNPYTIVSGDTFYKIARKFNVSLDDLLEANPGIDPDKLLIGQVICIPLATPPVTCPQNSITYIIKAGDTFGKLAVLYNTTVAELIRLNPGVRPQALLIGQKICIPRSTEQLPQTKNIPVFVEGETEYRPATLKRSPQGYFIYILENFTFTPEEPGRDVIFSNFDDSFFIRIEKLPDNGNISELRENALTELRAIGTPVEMQGTEIFDPFFRNAKFFLHASNSTVSKNIVVMEIDGGLFRFNMHIPNAEAAEGIVPSFYAMLKTIGIQ